MRIRVVRHWLTRRWYIMLIVDSGETAGITRQYRSKEDAVRAARAMHESHESRNLIVEMG